jgi:hypothetical protein
MRSAILQSDALRIPFADQSVDLVIGSPPYVDARLYLENGRNLGISRSVEAWVEWMLEVTVEAIRVSRGAVIWIAAGVTRDRTYWPACEGLMWEWYKLGGSAYRPCYWHRVGIPGSGGDQWYRADVEYAMCFKRPGKLPYAVPTANGKPPKFGVGGAMSYRHADGVRRNAKTGGRMNKTKSGYSDGKPTYLVNVSPMPDIANPGTMLSTGAGGGGNIGDHRAHENEAPYPTEVPAWFIRSHSPPGGLVLDPFGGSGTTAHAAMQEGRRGIVCDLRRSQCDLSRRRLREVTPALFTMEA